MKEIFLEFLKNVYFAIPVRYRHRVFVTLIDIPLFRKLLNSLAYPDFHKDAIDFLQKVGTSKRQQPKGSFISKPVPDLQAFSVDEHDSTPSLNIGITIHAYYLDLFAGLVSKLKHIPYQHQLYVTGPKENIAEIRQILSEQGLSATIVEVSNVGFDLLPFLKVIPQLLEDDIDVVCKLHTKKGGANLEGVYPEIGRIWNDLLLEPIMGSSEVVTDIVKAFESDSDLGMIGSASMFKSARDLMYGNQIDVGRILASLGHAHRPVSDWGFFAGSMFWCRTELLRPLLTLLEQERRNNTAFTGQSRSHWHALERVLGILPVLNDKKIGLSFIKDTRNRSHVVAVVGQGQSEAFANRFGVGLTLFLELALEEDQEYLQEAIRTECLKGVGSGRLGIDPIVYYLRYGVFLEQELLDMFNSQTYWHLYKDVLENRQNPLVHYLKKGKKEGRFCFPAKTNTDAARRLIEASDIFDKAFYLSENPEVTLGKVNPVQHFCESGWLEHRDPNPGFDTWNYWQEHLDPGKEIINPAVYKLIVEGPGKRTNRTISLSEGFKFEEGAEIRRICLFAAYDPNDTVDKTAIDYITELNRFSDVYYLSDGHMPASELSKLDGLVKGAWSFRHGEYDFGSYARLATNLVGWNRIESYDELILANDSCYLIRPLAPVFQKMERARCDWWGLQATKGVAKTRWKKSNRFKRNIPISEVRDRMLAEFEAEDFYDFLIGSYFLAFRKPVIEGEELREILKNVRPEKTKLDVIRKYEIGITRKLINSGYRFDTYIDDLFTFHPIYTNNHFELINRGFPFFKRFFLTENHYRVPDLWRWEQKLLAMAPELDLTPIRDNLQRVSSPEKLWKNLHRSPKWWKRKAYPGLLSNWRFAWLDRRTRKNANWWVFPVCAYDHHLTGNDRAVFEAVKNDPTIRKIILVRDKHFEGGGENVDVLPLRSPQAQRLLTQSKVIFVKHTLNENVGYPIVSNLHHVINLWHGSPLKRIGYASLDSQDKLDQLAQIHSRMTSVICSSEVDQIAMASSFYPLTYNDIWLTGLPRIDFILEDEESLPEDMQDELKLLDELLAGRKLVLFCPTFRNEKENGKYPFSQREKSALLNLMKTNNFVLGIREHIAVSSDGYLDSLGESATLDLSNQRFRNIEMIYRKAEMLITDYSSCFIDFMVTDKPVVSFAYDYESYVGQERGLFYDLEFAFPGPVCRSFSELIHALTTLIESDSRLISKEEYKHKRRLFFKYIDALNSQRVVERVRGLSEMDGTAE